MEEEKFILDCPHCGRVEGFFSSPDGEPDETPEGEMVIEEESVRTPEGPKIRLRCPRCGRWVSPDRARPA